MSNCYTEDKWTLLRADADISATNLFLKEECEDFFVLISGKKPAANEAQKIFNMRPKNTKSAQKFTLGIF